MAKIGLNNFRYGLLTEASDGTPTYGGAKKPAKAISCSVDVTNNEAKLYADDALAESDTSFQGGTVTMGIDNEDQATMAELLGHSVSEGEMIRNAEDVAPYVGLGRVIVKMVNGAYQYKVEFLSKVKFSEPSQEDATKGESLEFSTSELEGTIATLADGTWSKTKTFNTKQEAIAYLNGLLGGEASDTIYTVTYDENGGTGTTPNAVTVASGTMITLDDGAGLIPPTGKVFAGWDTTATSTAPDLVGTYTVTGDVTLYAIYVDE